MENQNNSPAVSIVIPMYNTEKYIGELLDSVLEQTFENFEVIVVDDCSTDKSFDIVKNYFPKFAEKNVAQGGVRLALLRFTKNTGSPSIPRNEGIGFARGEYLFFVNSDDVIAPNALELLYSAAKKTDADVLYCQRYYRFQGDNLKDAKITISEPTTKRLELIDDPLNKFLSQQLTGSTWKCIFRRKFIVQNKVQFPKLPSPFIYEDILFNFFAMFFAEKVAQTPGICYYNRHRPDATVKEHFKLISNSALYISKILEEFMESQSEFFQSHPKLKYEIYERFVFRLTLDTVFRKPTQVPINDRIVALYDSLDKLDDKKYLTAFLFDKLIDLRTAWRDNGRRIDQLKKELQTLDGTAN